MRLLLCWERSESLLSLTVPASYVLTKVKMRVRTSNVAILGLILYYIQHQSIFINQYQRFAKIADNIVLYLIDTVQKRQSLLGESVLEFESMDF